MAVKDVKNTDLCGQKKHLFFAKLLLEFRKTHSEITMDHAEEMHELAMSESFKETFNGEFGTEYDNEITLDLIKKFIRVLKSEVITTTSIIGGLAASEALKLTGKYTPIDQWYGYDQIKYLPSEISEEAKSEKYLDNVVTFGSEIQSKLSSLNVFLPGAGAIGCEALK